jgi:hypothetical protein
MLWTIIDMLGNSENMAGSLKEYTGKLSYSLTNNPKHYSLKKTKSSSRCVGVSRQAMGLRQYENPICKFLFWKLEKK